MKQLFVNNEEKCEKSKARDKKPQKEKKLIRIVGKKKIIQQQIKYMKSKANK